MCGKGRKHPGRRGDPLSFPEGTTFEDAVDALLDVSPESPDESSSEDDPASDPEEPQTARRR